MKNNSQRAMLAMTLICVVLGLEIVMLISSYLQLNLLQDIQDGVFVSDEEANANDMREAIVAIIFMVAYIISVVTFIQWFRRAYFNLHIRVTTLSYTEGWAAGSWFVPILNLFRPYQIMKEMYVETDRILTTEGSGPKPPLNLVFVNIWWALWVFNNILNNIISRYTWNAETVEEYIMSSQGEIVTAAIGVPLSLVAIKVIKDYSEMEEALRKSGPPPFTGFSGIDSEDNILDAPIR